MSEADQEKILLALGFITIFIFIIILFFWEVVIPSSV